VSDQSPAPSGDLQFDKAEPGEGQLASPTACAACQQPLASVYYQVNGRPACERCKAQLEYDQMSGSAVGNVLRAGAFGLLAALAGGAVWYAVRATTGYEVGLIAIVVGVMVGGAVRAGCRRRGGLGYQVLAVGLTYFGICVQYVPDIVKAIRDQQPSHAQKASASTATSASTTTPVGAAQDAQAAQATQAAAQPPASLASSPPAEHSRGVRILLALGFLLAFAMAAPFLGGFENIIGIFIIGFALWEAWKINRRVPMQIEGPFRLAAAPRGVGAS
jgi:hypothetical protein